MFPIDENIADASTQSRKLLPDATLFQVISFIANDQSELTITFSQGDGEVHGEFTAPYPQEELNLNRLSPALIKVRTDLAKEWQDQNPMNEDPSLINKPTLFGKNIELTVKEIRIGDLKLVGTANSRPGVFLLYDLKGIAKDIKPPMVQIEAYQDGVGLNEAMYDEIEGYPSHILNYSAEIKSGESLGLTNGYELLTDSPVQFLIYSRLGNVKIEDALVILAKP